MPEVVYPTDNPQDDTPRTWDQVFPDLSDHTGDWDIVNGILYQIALNNRFGKFTVDQLRENLNQNAFDDLEINLARSGENSDSRHNDFAHYGRTLYFIKEVFGNLGGAYREHKHY